MSTSRPLALAALAVLGLAACVAPADERPVSDIVSAQAADEYSGTLLSDPPVPRPALVLPDTEGEPYDLQADLPRTEGHVDPPGGPPHDDGELEHSGVVYLFGPGDQATVVHSGGTTAAQYVDDISALLRTG